MEDELTSTVYSGSLFTDTVETYNTVIVNIPSCDHHLKWIRQGQPVLRLQHKNHEVMNKLTNKLRVLTSTTTTLINFTLLIIFQDF